MQTTGKWILIGAGMVVAMGLGYVLSKGGKPYSTAIMTVHKLIPVAVVVYMVVALVRANRETALSPVLLVTAIVTGVFYLAAIATGGMLSAQENASKAVTTIHHVVPYLSITGTAAVAWLLK